MSEELNLVRDLAVILISAGIFTIISKALKQPLILGYIIAGFLIGPNINFFPGISSQETVSRFNYSPTVGDADSTFMDEHKDVEGWGER